MLCVCNGLFFLVTNPIFHSSNFTSGLPDPSKPARLLPLFLAT
jgi:hypothetical protein